jgi:hypothetical protein
MSSSWTTIEKNRNSIQIQEKKFKIYRTSLKILHYSEQKQSYLKVKIKKKVNFLKDFHRFIAMKNKIGTHKNEREI